MPNLTNDASFSENFNEEVTKRIITFMKKYRLPLANIILSDREIWGDQVNQPVMLRPNDMPLYGLPVATVNDMVYRASETNDPIPFMKLGRKTDSSHCFRGVVVAPSACQRNRNGINC